MKLLNKTINYFLCGLIMLYRCCISPLLRPRCRFLPTCSSYGVDAIKEWGWKTGTVLLIRRLLKCHPWGTSGFDPVPRPLTKDNDR